jgi:predicted phage baseplate assembly protein
LNALAYRVGTYASFFETMKARLSSSDFAVNGVLPLAALTTRDPSDPAIALLDAWAIVADVLTFYQERIANEGYLRTGTEQQSMINLAGLVGYALRPGVSASVFLAYTLEQSSQATIPAGSRVQNVPAQGTLPQSFETSGDLDARGVWNNLAPRLTQPQVISANSPQVYVATASANLKANDPVLIVASPPQPRRVASVAVDFANSRTQVQLLPLPDMAVPTVTPDSPVVNSFARVISLATSLSAPPADHPANSLQLARSAAKTFQPETDTTPALLKAFNPGLQHLYAGLKAAQVTPPLTGEFHALRVQAAPFGHNAPLRPITNAQGAVVVTEEWPLVGRLSIRITMSTRAEGEAEEGGGFVGRLLDLSRGGPSALVQISSSEGGGSVVAPLKTGDGFRTKIGKWEVDAKVGNSLDITFTVAKHRYAIQLQQDGKSIDVSLDGSAPSIQIPTGESSVTEAPGRRTLISSAQGILIDDEIAVAPTALNIVNLDMVYDQIVPGSYVVIDRADTSKQIVTTVTQTNKVSLTNYGMTARVTQLTLADNWLDPKTDLMLSVARNTTVSTQSEQLDLAQEPITDHVAGNQIELGNLYGGLKSGRWLIVQGERADIDGVTGAELVMLDNVHQGVQQIPGPIAGTTQDLPDDTTHSFLQLSSPLSYQYKRETTAVYANVVQATNGESRKEILGSGDGAQELQQFSLHQGPLTYLPAPNSDGAQSTLAVRVNGVLWNEVDSLANAGPNDRVYVTEADSTGKRQITFGTGRNGMRLPTGAANVIATYRSGIGTGANADASKVTLLASRPMGVKSVTNPIPASGGADGDTTDQARRNAPIAVAALDRLVSASDYGDFARSFAGIGKASSQSLSDGHRQVVFVTIAGSEGTVIDKSSALYTNLVLAFQEIGDPQLPVDVEICEFMLLVISAQIAVLPDYDFDDVAPQIRAALLATFSFDNQELAESIALSQVISAIQSVSGVQYVKVQVLDSISESDTESSDVLQAKLNEIAATQVPMTTIEVPGASLDTTTGTIKPAAVAFLSPDLPDTLILTEVTQ